MASRQLRAGRGRRLRHGGGARAEGGSGGREGAVRAEPAAAGVGRGSGGGVCGSAALREPPAKRPVWGVWGNKRRLSPRVPGPARAPAELWV